MTLPADPRGASFLTLLYREHYTEGLAARLSATLDAAFRDLARIILTEFPDLSPARWDRVALLFGRVTQLLGERYGIVERELIAELGQYGQLEQAVAAAELRAFVARSPYADGVDLAFTGPTRARMVAIAELPVRGEILGESLSRQWAAMSDAARQQIRLGLTYGEGPDKIVRRLHASRLGAAPVPVQLETPDAATAGGVARRAKRDVATLVRTATTTVQSEAARSTYAAAGNDVVDRWRYTATLDGRTSEICRGLSGTIWRMDDPAAPWPAQHPNCRSSAVPLLAPALARAMGVPTDGVQPRHGFRSYEDWARTLSVAEQDRILGKTKAGLWRAGKITLRDLVAQDTRTLTLDQLAQRLGVARSELRTFAAAP